MQRKRARNPHKIGVNKSCEAAVISISTSRFVKYGSVKTPEEAEDLSGRIIIDLLENAGHHLHLYTLVSDEGRSITEAINGLVSDVDVVITTGGTGLAPRDVTIEAIQQMFRKDIPGFGELFRSISYEQIGSSAMLTRASSGIIENTAIFCLPGSPNAVKLAMEALILPELQHILLHVSER
jgi:molybdenum cofactor biosynthesis protein B